MLPEYYMLKPTEKGQTVNNNNREQGLITPIKMDNYTVTERTLS